MKKIMIFIEGTTFYKRLVLLLFSKRGYKPLGNAVKIINDLFDKGNKFFFVHMYKRIGFI